MEQTLIKGICTVPPLAPLQHYYKTGLCSWPFVPAAFGPGTIGGFCPGSNGQPGQRGGTGAFCPGLRHQPGQNGSLLSRLVVPTGTKGYADPASRWTRDKSHLLSRAQRLPGQMARNKGLFCSSVRRVFLPFADSCVTTRIFLCVFSHLFLMRHHLTCIALKSQLDLITLVSSKYIQFFFCEFSIIIKLQFDQLAQKKRMTLRVYFHIDDTDHDFVHARARQQRLYDIYSHTCNLFTSLYWLLFFMLKNYK